MGALYVGSGDVTSGTGGRRPPFLPVVAALVCVLAMALGAGSALAGYTERVSINRQGNSGSFTNWQPSVSADGRYVVFYSWATNLVAGDTNDYGDVFLWTG